MNREEGEGVAVARLIGADRVSMVGRVYRWDTGALKILWLNGPKRVTRLEPDLSDADKREIEFDRLTRIRARNGGTTSD